MSVQRPSLIARVATLALATGLSFFMAMACGGGGGGSATSTALTTDQANTVGTAAVNLALQSMSDSLSAVQASASISKGVDFSKAVSGKSTVTIGNLTLAATSSCDLPTVTVCANPSKTVAVTLTGTSGSCTGTAKVCDIQNFVNLTCTDYTANGATLNGTVLFAMNTDSCDPVSSVAANMSATVNGTSHPISLSLATVKTDTQLGTSGCFAVDGSGFSFSTSINASDVATCSGSCTQGNLTQLGALFTGKTCNYVSGGVHDATTTYSYADAVDSDLTADQVTCMLYAACSKHNETQCVTEPTLEDEAAGCGVTMNGGTPTIANVIYASFDGGAVTTLTNGDSLTMDALSHSAHINFGVDNAPNLNVTQTCVVCDTDVNFGSAYEVSCNDASINSINAVADQMQAAEFRANCWNGFVGNTYNTAFKVRYKKNDGSYTDTGTTFGIDLTLNNLP